MSRLIDPLQRPFTVPLPAKYSGRKDLHGEGAWPNDAMGRRRNLRFPEVSRSQSDGAVVELPLDSDLRSAFNCHSVCAFSNQLYNSKQHEQLADSLYFRNCH